MSSSIKTALSKEKRITVMMGIITLVFFLCVSPYFIYFMAPFDTTFKERVLPYIVILMYLNSLINPLLYMAINKNVRLAAARLLRREGTASASTDGPSSTRRSSREDLLDTAPSDSLSL